MIWTGLLIENRRQCALEEAEEVEEPKHEPDGFVVGCTVFQEIDSNEQRAELDKKL
jgi:hypothetical protein